MSLVDETRTVHRAMRGSNICFACGYGMPCHALQLADLVERYQVAADKLDVAHDASIIKDGALREVEDWRLVALIPFLLALDDLRSLRLLDKDGTLL